MIQVGTTVYSIPALDDLTARVEQIESAVQITNQYTADISESDLASANAEAQLLAGQIQLMNESAKTTLG